MKITRYVCDRCRKEVSRLERTEVEIQDIASGQQIDLCPECAEVLDAWLHWKEAEQ